MKLKVKRDDFTQTFELRVEFSNLFKKFRKNLFAGSKFSVKFHKSTT